MTKPWKWLGLGALLCFLLLLASIFVPVHFPGWRNRLPDDVKQALRAPDKVVLYSLEPEWPPDDKVERFYAYKILGHIDLNPDQAASAISEFESTVSSWNGDIFACFDPRHALRVTAAGHTYDLLLCYQCHGMEVRRDGKLIASLGATGSPKVLNAILTAANIPLAHTDSDADIAARVKENEDLKERWMAAMPKSIRSAWTKTMWDEPLFDVEPLRKALNSEIPNPRQRILALYAWYGSGQGPWSGYPAWEMAAENLLLDFPTPALIAAAQSNDLTDQQIEGAARFFGDGELTRQRPDDQNLLPPALKKKLLDHSLKSTDQDKIERAKSAFERP